MLKELSWFDIGKYDIKELEKLDAKGWLKLLDIREYYYSFIQLAKAQPSLNINILTKFTDFLKNPLDVDSHRENYSDITTNYETETYVEKLLKYKVQDKAINSLSKGDINNIIELNKPTIKSIINNRILQTLDPINGHKGISEIDIEKLDINFPGEKNGIKYLKIDTRHSQKHLIEEFTEFIEKETKPKTTKDRQNIHGFTPKYKKKLITHKPLPILDLMMYKDIKQLKINDVDIYPKIFNEKDVYFSGNIVNPIKLAVEP